MQVIVDDVVVYKLNSSISAFKKNLYSCNSLEFLFFSP